MTPKPLASLSSGLLARKGQARPAMRPQSFGLAPVAGEDDLGWNDLGDAAPMPPVLVERQALAREVAAVTEPSAPAEPARQVSPATAARLARESAALTAGRKAAFTLRLDADRHLRLRLAAALDGRSAQLLVTEALDAFLSNRPGLDPLVAGLAPSARSGS